MGESEGTILWHRLYIFCRCEASRLSKFLIYQTKQNLEQWLHEHMDIISVQKQLHADVKQKCVTLFWQLRARCGEEQHTKKRFIVPTAVAGLLNLVLHRLASSSHFLPSSSFSRESNPQKLSDQSHSINHGQLESAGGLAVIPSSWRRAAEHIVTLSEHIWYAWAGQISMWYFRLVRWVLIYRTTRGGLVLRSGELRPELEALEVLKVSGQNNTGRLFWQVWHCSCVGAEMKQDRGKTCGSESSQTSPLNCRVNRNQILRKLILEHLIYDAHSRRLEHGLMDV